MGSVVIPVGCALAALALAGAAVAGVFSLRPTRYKRNGGKW